MKELPSHIVSSLLKGVDLPHVTWKATPISGTGETNSMWLLSLATDERYVVRVYNWPHVRNDFLERVRKEPFLHRHLEKHDVPVAPILSVYDQPHESAILMAYLPGRLIGDVTGALLREDRNQAWHSVGQMLRRAHDIEDLFGTAGWIVGEQVQPFSEGGWTSFIVSGYLSKS